MRASTWAQKSVTVDPVETRKTSGTIPATMPGSVFDSGLTRLPTGKSSTTSEPHPDQPRISSAHAAVMTDDRGMSHAWDNC